MYLCLVGRLHPNRFNATSIERFLKRRRVDLDVLVEDMDVVVADLGAGKKPSSSSRINDGRKEVNRKTMTTRGAVDSTADEVLIETTASTLQQHPSPVVEAGVGI
ncbi:hypothetical protein QVD17_38544 [Tagetes erecta]|uniref:Uncharacterized protein n=1 Tax=Tagetes erecta TaxID=13708 RepID=A0AAD8N9F3_TARER|nr:hypothetical protein QVD17_38544 [Tagetes erecta]